MYQRNKVSERCLMWTRERVGDLNTSSVPHATKVKTFVSLWINCCLETHSGVKTSPLRSKINMLASMKSQPRSFVPLSRASSASRISCDLERCTTVDVVARDLKSLGGRSSGSLSNSVVGLSCIATLGRAIVMKLRPPLSQLKHSAAVFPLRQ